MSVCTKCGRPTRPVPRDLWPLLEPAGQLWDTCETCLPCGVLFVTLAPSLDFIVLDLVIGPDGSVQENPKR